MQRLKLNAECDAVEAHAGGEMEPLEAELCRMPFVQGNCNWAS
jgi:hypothetical protein